MYPKNTTSVQPGSTSSLAEAQAEVERYRWLAAGEPDQFRRHLPLALHRLALELASSGRSGEALVAAEEAVRTFRPVAAEPPSSYDRSILAAFLAVVYGHLSAAGRHQEALGPALESVTLRRSREAEHPGSAASGLAVSLWRLGDCLWALDRRAEALAVGEQAAKLLRRLVAEGSSDHRWAHLSHLHIHGDRLGQVGRLDGMVAAVAEAVASRRELFRSDPATWAEPLARDLHRLGACQLAASQSGDAGPGLLTTIEALAALAGELQGEQSRSCGPKITDALADLGHRLSGQGRHHQAAAAFERAVEVLRPLAGDQPAEHQPTLANSLYNLACELAGLGRDEAALDPAREALWLSVHGEGLVAKHRRHGDLQARLRRYLELCEATGLAPDDDLVVRAQAMADSRAGA